MDLEKLAAELPYSDYENIVELVGFSSAKRKTQVLRQPEIATNAEVLGLSKLFGISPQKLHDEYGVGAAGATDIEKETWAYLEDNELPEWKNARASAA